MSITIKKIFKLHRPKNGLRLMDDTMGPDYSGSSSNLAYTTMQETDTNGNPLPIYVINWWVANLSSARDNNIREIDEFVAPWPPVAYIDSQHTQAAFSYLCWDGSNYFPSNSASGCGCTGGTSTDSQGNCVGQKFPPDDRNGGAASTPFYPTGNIVINYPGQYGIQLILDGYIPACQITKKVQELPTLMISYYKSIDDMIPYDYNGNGIAPTPIKMADNCTTEFFSTKQVTVPYNNQTYSTWWPQTVCSTVAPQPSVDNTKNPTQMTFNGVFVLEANWILQFSLQNTCTPTEGSFTGTIQITPQFTTYPA